eukprot:TRINITY_DN2192_c0_g3_i1.p1 TRINITY_DN2192_c0_g3~~TRINITY_DN2192_c0_g3_i1.p1  ORF type:complete len:265 (-),score=-10.85 TRINITY_DN2192_c0_g3_i1:108-902(-)
MNVGFGVFGVLGIVVFISLIFIIQNKIFLQNKYLFHYSWLFCYRVVVIFCKLCLKGQINKLYQWVVPPIELTVLCLYFLLLNEVTIFEIVIIIVGRIKIKMKLHVPDIPVVQWGVDMQLVTHLLLMPLLCKKYIVGFFLQKYNIPSDFQNQSEFQLYTESSLFSQVYFNNFLSRSTIAFGYVYYCFVVFSTSIYNQFYVNLQEVYKHPHLGAQELVRSHVKTTTTTTFVVCYHCLDNVCTLEYVKYKPERVGLFTIDKNILGMF